MPESTLSLGLPDFRSSVGHYLGHGKSVAGHNAEEREEHDERINTGERDVFKAYPWSFLEPLWTIVTSGGQHEYVLPDDYGGLRGALTFIGPASVEQAKLFALSRDDFTLSRIEFDNIVGGIVQQQLVGDTGLAATGLVPDGMAYSLANALLYVITGGAINQLHSIDPVTAAATLITLDLTVSLSEGGMAITPAGVAYYAAKPTGGSTSLYTINLTTGATSLVAVLTPNVDYDIDGLGWRSDGMLIAIDSVSRMLITIDPTTGATSEIATMLSVDPSQPATPEVVKLEGLDAFIQGSGAGVNDILIPGTKQIPDGGLLGADIVPGVDKCQVFPTNPGVVAGIYPIKAILSDDLMEFDSSEVIPFPDSTGTCEFKIFTPATIGNEKWGGLTIGDGDIGYYVSSAPGAIGPNSKALVRFDPNVPGTAAQKIVGSIPTPGALGFGGLAFSKVAPVAPIANANTCRPISYIGEGEIRRMRSCVNRTGIPEFAAVLPERLGDSGGQRHKLLLYPTPDTNYGVQFQYSILPQAMTDARPFPLGGMAFSELYRAACLAAAERDSNDIANGPKEIEYQRQLQMMIAREEEFGVPDSLGVYGNRTHGGGGGPYEWTIPLRNPIRFASEL